MGKMKRTNGSGYFKKLKSGNWLGQIMDGYTEDGKKRVVSFTAPTKSEVQQKIMQYQADRAEGKLVLQKTTPFSTWAKYWYADYQSQVQPSTYSGYKYTLKTLTDYFQDKPLSDFKQIHVNHFMDHLVKTGVSRSKISKCKAMLTQIFDAAEENDLVLKNPARHAKVIRDISQTENKKDAFSEDEVARLIEELPDNLLGNSIRTLLGSGLRVQELLALTPSDIAEDGSLIKVNKAIKTVNGKPVLGVTKSKQGKRDIPIPPSYRPYVKALLAQGGRTYIWTSSRNNLLYSVGTFRQHYYKAIRIADIRALPPHCCRHTYITRLQACGISIDLIARLAGHSDITTTNGYIHTSSETLEKAVSALDVLLGG